jgi:hypothetical protein
LGGNQLTGDSNANILKGGPFNDEFVGNLGNDSMDGVSASDFLNSDAINPSNFKIEIDMVLGIVNYTDLATNNFLFQYNL